ncbi:MAG: CBU_0592 family membrane protein [Betaproteobacteria bacterium]
MNSELIDLLGWGGAAAVLVAYGLVSAGRVTGRSGFYQVLNAVGSALLMVNTYYYRAYPSTFVNVLWLGIAVYALARTGRRREGGQGG